MLRKTMLRKTMRRKTMRRKTMRKKTMRRKNILKRYTGGSPTEPGNVRRIDEETMRIILDEQWRVVEWHTHGSAAGLPPPQTRYVDLDGHCELLYGPRPVPPPSSPPPHDDDVGW